MRAQPERVKLSVQLSFDHNIHWRFDLPFIDLLARTFPDVTLVIQASDTPLTAAQFCHYIRTGIDDGYHADRMVVVACINASPDELADFIDMFVREYDRLSSSIMFLSRHTRPYPRKTLEELAMMLRVVADVILPTRTPQEQLADDSQFG